MPSITRTTSRRIQGETPMRLASACAVFISISTGVLGAAWAQTRPAPAPAAAPTLAAAPPPAAAPGATCAGNPNALGVSRVVEIDTTGGPGFGWEHFKMHDFLRDREVVLTFEDRKSTRLNSSHLGISYAVFCLKK